MYNLLALLILCSFSMGMVANAVRDPTQPPGANPAQTFTATPGKLQIEAIFFSKDGKNSFIIIEGKKLAVGDEIMGATIIKIEPHVVTLKDDNGEFTITMPAAQIKSLTKKNTS